jgi:hypothetical protein
MAGACPASLSVAIADVGGIGAMGALLTVPADNAVPPDLDAQCEALLVAAPAPVSSIMGVFPPHWVDRFEHRGLRWLPPPPLSPRLESPPMLGPTRSSLRATKPAPIEALLMLPPPSVNASSMLLHPLRIPCSAGSRPQ